MRYAAVLPLEPEPAPRPRARAFLPPGKSRWIASVYTPEAGPYKKWMAAATLLLRAARRGGKAFEGPVRFDVVFLFPMPEGEKRVRTPKPRRWHVAKPDLDNVLKSVWDAAKYAGWYADDSQVCEVSAQKVVERQGGRAAVHVTCTELEPYADPTGALPGLPLEQPAPTPPEEECPF